MHIFFVCAAEYMAMELKLYDVQFQMFAYVMTTGQPASKCRGRASRHAKKVFCIHIFEPYLILEFVGLAKSRKKLLLV